MARKTKKRKLTEKQKIFLLTLGLGVAGGAAYLTWDYVKRKQAQSQVSLPTNTGDTVINITNALPTTTTSSTSGGDSFPLKQGSKGARVTQLQQALARILGSAVMTANGGIDGIFGPGTANALKLAGYGANITEALFTQILNQTTSVQTTFDAEGIADSLYRNARAGDISGTLAVLQQITSVDQYSQVNTYYKKIPTFVSKTIVTDLLDDAFESNESAKQQIRNEFLRMGLKMIASGTWSLSGFYKDLITLRPTYVLDAYNNRIPVNPNTILGDEVKNVNGITWFWSIDNNLLQVPTQDVKYT